MASAKATKRKPKRMASTRLAFPLSPNFFAVSTMPGIRSTRAYSASFEISNSNMPSLPFHSKRPEAWTSGPLYHRVCYNLLNWLMHHFPPSRYIGTTRESLVRSCRAPS